MEITHLRHATAIVRFGDASILVDPMLSPMGSLPPLRWFTKRRSRNPITDMPACAEAMLDTVTHALITHCQRHHFDHLDRPAVRFLRSRGIPVFCVIEDDAYLRERGLNTRPLRRNCENKFLDGVARLVPCQHGYGWITHFMANGVGYVIRLPGEPSLYIIGDTVLTSEVRSAIAGHRPDWLILPAGVARLDIGGPVLMNLEEILEAVSMVPGKVILNHMEALDHCRLSRQELQHALRKKGLSEKVIIPADGDTIKC
jgi:L-ascorbate metabolism protein UlaG (beta-lactamase superfamily)